MERTLTDLVHRLGQNLDAAFEGRTKGSAITPRQLAVLRAAKEWNGVSQTTLVEKTGVDRSTLADIVKRLVQRGWLSRRRAKDDARAYVVRCTTEGAGIINAHVPALLAIEKAALASLTKAEADALKLALDRMNNHLVGDAKK